MENIVEPNENFDFSKITLAHPSGIQGGAYFTKIEYMGKPLYIQTTKSLTRQGIVKTGKKYYCDLMFDNNSEILINWFENLEETCQKLIYNKSESWFQNHLEITDVENAFSSVLRVYKSGKYYLVRTNVKNSQLTNEPAVKIYNENEVSLTINDVSNETNIISILEVQGIKFTTRNFQIEIELKQIMVLNNEKIFESCLIKKKGEKKTENQNTNLQPTDNLETIKDLENIEDLESIEDLEINSVSNFEDEKNKEMNTTSLEKSKIDLINESNITEDTLIRSEPNNNETNYLDEIHKLDYNNDGLHSSNSENITEIDLDLEIEDLTNETINEESKDLKEVELNFGLEQQNNLETMTLKKPNQVYYELYKEARQKAKVAKKMAIIAYLEAKNIKKSYMIENLNESDSDFDAEIDDVSESELEGL